MACQLMLSVAMLGWLTTSTNAKPVDWLQRIDQRYHKLKGIKADFSQELQNPRLSEPLKNSGTVLFSLPGKMRWEYRQPKRFMVSNAKWSWTYDVGDKQLLLSRQLPKNEAMSFLWGEGSLSKNYTAKVTQLLPKSVQLHLRPRQATAVESIDITYDLSLHVITALTLVDNQKNRNQLNFTNINLDPKIGNEFDYNPPKGVTVVEMP